MSTLAQLEPELVVDFTNVQHNYAELGPKPSQRPCWSVRQYADYAVTNIAQECATERLECFPQVTKLLIEVALGGSNVLRSSEWKEQFQE